MSEEGYLSFVENQLSFAVLHTKKGKVRYKFKEQGKLFLHACVCDVFVCAFD